MSLKSLAGSGLLTLLTFLATSLAQMTHEETVVRTAYAKLAYAVQLNEIYHFTSDSKGNLSERLRKNEIRFNLTDVRSGKISDITADKYADLVTEPDGRDVIHATVASIDYTERGKKVTMDTVSAQWGKGQTVNEDWNVPLSKLLPAIQDQNRAAFSRYVACTVTVDYQGKQETYKALWLFGQDYDSNPYTVAGDTIIGINGNSLHHVANHPIYPAVLLETPSGDKPEIRDWFAAHVVPSCGVDHDSCCDTQSLQCGISAANLQRSLGEREANR